MSSSEHTIAEVVSNTAGVPVRGKQLLQQETIVSSTPGDLIAGAAILAAQDSPNVCPLDEHYHQQSHDGTSCPVPASHLVARMSDDRAAKIAENAPNIEETTAKIGHASELDALTAAMRSRSIDSKDPDTPSRGG